MENEHIFTINDGRCLTAYKGPGGEIVIPEGVAAIADKVFMGRKDITGVTLPESLKRLGECAFKGCTMLKSIRVPAGVKVIEAETFRGCTKLERVELPEGLEEFENGAFRMCKALKDLEIPESVTIIGPYTFSRCAALKRVTVPAGVRELPYGAFGYVGLEELTILGKSVDVDKYACAEVRKIVAPNMELWHIPSEKNVEAVMGFTEWLGKGNPVDGEARKSYADYVRRRRSYFLDDAEGAVNRPHLLHFMIEEKIIPQEAMDRLLKAAEKKKNAPVTGMLLEYQNAAFGPADLDKEFKRRMRSIETGAMPLAEFKKWWKSKRLPDKTLCITAYLGDEREVHVPPIVGKTKVTVIGFNAFSDSKTLERAVLPEGVTEIEGAAFSRCRNLREIVFPESLEKVGGSAFSGCRALESVTLPGKLTALADGLFEDCTALEKVVLPKELVYLSSSDNQWGGYAFRGCTALKELHIPAAVKGINSGNVFEGCVSLTAWDVDPKSRNMKAVGPLLMSKSGKTVYRCLPGFQGEVTVPEGVTKIIEQAFCVCTGVTAVHLPESLKTIEDSAFFGCTALERAELPAGLTEVGISAFARCTALKEAVFPEGLKKLGVSAFEGCTSLGGITLPESLEEINDYCFRGCINLEISGIPAGVKEVGNSAFEGCARLAEHIDFPAEEAVSQYVFKGCTSLKSVSFAGEYGIVSEAFEGCTALERIDLPQRIGYINKNAFKGCPQEILFTAPADSEALAYLKENGFQWEAR